MFHKGFLFKDTIEYRRKRKRKSKTTMVLGLKFFGSSNENYWLKAIKSNIYNIRITIIARSIKSEKKQVSNAYWDHRNRLTILALFYSHKLKKTRQQLCIFFSQDEFHHRILEYELSWLIVDIHIQIMCQTMCFFFFT